MSVTSQKAASSSNTEAELNDTRIERFNETIRMIAETSLKQAEKTGKPSCSCYVDSDIVKLVAVYFQRFNVSTSISPTELPHKKWFSIMEYAPF